MTIANSADPLDLILKDFARDAGDENLDGLTPPGMTALATRLWTWASAQAPDAQAVRVLPRVVETGRPRALLEAAGPDMPFLVDSLLGACASEGHEVRALFHPIVTRDGGARQSVIQMHLPELTAGEAQRLEREARTTLAENAVIVADFEPMRARMQQEIVRVNYLNHVPAEDRAETVAFLEWLSKDHFVFLGVREYRFETDARGNVLPEEPVMIEGSNLGLLRDGNRDVLARESEPLVLTKEMGEFLAEPFPLIVAKSTLISRVHRRVPADYVGVKTYDEAGKVTGEVRFLGLFTAEAYDETGRSIPFIRRRVAKIIERAGASKGGYTEKALANLIETWPRDELLQTHSRDLAPMIMGALHLIGRPRTRAFFRKDQFGRFVSVIVYVPREAYDTVLRQRVGDLLVQAYRGRLVRFQPYFDASGLTRVHYEIALDKNATEPDQAALESEIAALARTWDQGLRESLMASGQPEDEREGARAFLGAFTAGYRDTFPPEEAIADIAAMAPLSARRPVLARAYRLPTDEAARVRVKIYSRTGAIALSRCVPVFERMGLFVDFETGYPVRPHGKPAADAPDTYWVHALSMHTLDGRAIDLAARGHDVEDLFEAVWNGRLENDAFNKLVLAAGLNAREAGLIRALAAWRRQSGQDPTEDVQAEALVRYPEITRHLVSLFNARFDPKGAKSLDARRTAAQKVETAIEDALKNVSALADDQVLRRLALLIGSIQRTNFWQTAADGGAHRFLSFKIASGSLENLPEPKPFREIFMSSPRVEGVHLRFGPVARGGLRWSDRASDYRTEVLGLVKAQQVKNAVIVPVGSKGGFYPKQLPDRNQRDAWFDEGTNAYKEFITALLGLTDNLAGGAVTHPKDTVIWDGEDPYLVVAADKGTATFSDTANAISLDKGHWLGDAFASGGSAGYDHKKMGITARGVWEAVKRHFREMGKDIQTEPFTVIGVGDMAGDVFGNGMLLSPVTRLLAAFNHQHIFLDPNPSSEAKSFAERQRLFNLARSTWADYDKSLISNGGGIFERAAKSIKLSAEIKVLTGLTADSVTPDQLIHALLKSPCDLMWFGGIGTYVKASKEGHSDAGDRANDSVRVDGRDLKAKVIGEGANLGMTQAARIEFAQKGGRINTDAIDNSAGVDSSDHEVNIKILCAEAIRLGNLKSEARNELLASMTDDVARLVLNHNYDQSAALTIAAATADTDHEALERLMVWLEQRGALNRALEGLPDTAAMQTRGAAKQWLTRPELAVLLAWSKIVLFNDVVASDIPDDAYYTRVLKAYFPPALQRFDKAMDGHRLKREIIATVIANRVLDAAGPVALLRLRELNACDNAAAVRGHEAARAVLNFGAFKAATDALDNQADARVQTELRLEAAHALHEAASWFIRERPGVSVGQNVSDTAAPLSDIRKTLGAMLTSYPAARNRKASNDLIKAGAPDIIAREAAELEDIALGLNIADLAQRSGKSVREAGDAFYRIGEALHTGRLVATAHEGLETTPYWDRIAGRRLINELTRIQTDAAQAALKSGGAEIWLTSQGPRLTALMAELAELDREPIWSFAKFALSADAIRSFMRSAG